jgi:hypothetical protein
MKLLAVFLPFILLLNSNVSSQNRAANSEFSFMFYNVENFFDCENDSLTNDDEFTPDGDRRWNYGRLHSKTERLAKVILAAGKWNPPVLVGLCEIENSTVLELLTKSKLLNQHNYKIVHKDSPDERGIDVALIYRPEFFRPFDYQAIPLIDLDDKSFKTRDILHVSGVLNGCDTLHVLVNHWPSRYGGIMETIKYRRLAAETLSHSIQGVLGKDPLAKIVCMGDFNDSPKDESLTKVLGSKANDDPKVSGEMINLSFGWLSDNVLTIKSQYTWEVFDQWIVSDSFLGSNSCYKFLKAEIFSPDFLLEPDRKFGGVKPKRTYVGFKYQEGFSDHLPILLRVQLNDH